jgi:TRAP-type uncharacterized transport system substrate-binding protein
MLPRKHRRLREIVGTLSPRELALVGVPSAALLLVVFYAAFRLVDPAPPRKIVIATSAPGSGYERFARLYAQRLGRDGVELEIRLSGGSLENLARLRDPASGVQAAFTTTGAALPGDEQTIASLGGLFYSPIFVFYRAPQPLQRFSQLKGGQISIGTTGTFVRGYAHRILEESGALGGRTALSELENDGALDALLAGRLDAAIFPAPFDAPVVQRAIASPSLRLLNVAQADAITKKLPALTHVVMPRGLISLERDEPREDIHLLATSNSLLVRKDLHPALQYLLLEAMREAHSPPGAFQKQGEFPSVSPQDLPLSQQAERFYRSGRPWLYQYTNFWLAVLLDRVVLILIPVVLALIPILRYAPGLYLWLNRRRIWRLHRELAELDSLSTERPESKEEHRARLAEIEAAVRELSVPLPFEDEVYHLRSHLALLHRRLLG